MVGFLCFLLLFGSIILLCYALAERDIKQRIETEQRIREKYGDEAAMRFRMNWFKMILKP